MRTRSVSNAPPAQHSPTSPDPKPDAIPDAADEDDEPLSELGPDDELMLDEELLEAPEGPVALSPDAVSFNLLQDLAATRARLDALEISLESSHRARAADAALIARLKAGKAQPPRPNLLPDESIVQSPAPTPPTPPRFASTDPALVYAYLAEFRMFLAVCRITSPAEQMYWVFSRADGAFKALLAQYCLGPNALASLSAVEAKLRSHLDPPVTGALELAAFHGLSQDAVESCAAYAARARLVISQCSAQIGDQLAASKFLNGLRDPGARKHLLLLPNIRTLCSDFENLLLAAKHYEEASLAAYHLPPPVAVALAAQTHGQPWQGEGVRRVTFSPPPASASESRPSQRFATPRNPGPSTPVPSNQFTQGEYYRFGLCHCCGEQGHRIADCPLRHQQLLQEQQQYHQQQQQRTPMYASGNGPARR